MWQSKPWVDRSNEITKQVQVCTALFGTKLSCSSNSQRYCQLFPTPPISQPRMLPSATPRHQPVAVLTHHHNIHQELHQDLHQAPLQDLLQGFYQVFYQAKATAILSIPLKPRFTPRSPQPTLAPHKPNMTCLPYYTRSTIYQCYSQPQIKHWTWLSTLASLTTYIIHL